MIGRRVTSMADLIRAGDYFGPVKGWTGDKLSVFFLLPNRDTPRPDLPEQPPGHTRAGLRSVHHVSSPPHVFRECDDGSLEIRESIGAQPYWHGYLDEGHVWREV